MHLSYCSFRNKKEFEGSLLDHYQVIKTVGHGATSKVKLVQDPTTEQLYAAKIFKISHNNFLEQRNLLLTEIECVGRIRHKSVIKIFSHHENGNYYTKNGHTSYRCMYILMEYCSNGELYDLIKAKGNFSETVTRFFFQQIIDVIEACHKAGVYHGDLKPENILFDDQFNLRLADFGSSDYNNISNLHEYKGTECYMPPEIRQHLAYSGETSDIFVAGIILFIMFVGVPPFNFADLNDHFFRCLASEDTSIMFWKYFQRRHPEVEFTDEFMDLIEKMLKADPGQRIKISDIKEDPWYNGKVPLPTEIVDFMTKDLED
ncbi:unnamed protein product [Blepharisma stoltei]|uniref:non-specific serine/threonine protein kinase n=1 Tax=Blepharisma stoltei TaxID=1481888 RepID=A0AAU9KN38_9CILI|nr:unnamed protein product [Blepharisma stoltei]